MVAIDDTNKCEAHSAEWAAFRKTGLGGSDMAAIVGLSPYSTAFDVWCQVTGAVEDEPTTYKAWGRKLESVIVEAYQEEIGVAVYANNTTYRHIDHPWALYTPDGFVGSAYTYGMPVGKGLECKNTNVRQAHRWGTTGTDEIPDEYLIQVQWYMGLCGAKEWDVAVLVGGHDFRVYTIKFNQSLFDSLIEAGRAFWLDYVLTNTPPPVSGSKKAEEYIRKLYPTVLAPMRSANSDEYDKLLRLEQINTTLKPLAKEVDTLKNELRLSIGGAEGVEYGEYIATYRQNKATPKTDYEAAFNDLAEKTGKTQLAEEILKHRTKAGIGPRVLRMKFPKQDDDN